MYEYNLENLVKIAQKLWYKTENKSAKNKRKIVIAGKMGAQIRRVNSSAKFLLPFFLFSFPVFSKTIFYNFLLTTYSP